jgi:hypothetical protein
MRLGRVKPRSSVPDAGRELELDAYHLSNWRRAVGKVQAPVSMAHDGRLEFELALCAIFLLLGTLLRARF